MLELVVFFTSSIPASIPNMIAITHLNSSTFWQTYLSDSASVTMEGIVMFLIVLFVAWVLFYSLYYFIEYDNKFSF